jgi:Family of unknown function (DUF6159)
MFWHVSCARTTCAPEQGSPMADIISSFSRSWRLIKASIAILNSDGELLALPLVSGLATLIVGGALIWQATRDGTLAAMQGGAGFAGLQNYYLWLFVFYLVEYFIIIFFNTALVGAAIDRLEGRDPTLRSALGLALRRIGPIFGYAVISATVGIISRLLSERLGIIGKIFGAGIGLAWTIATFLVIPVLAAEGIGPIEAIEKSAGLLRKSWGENLIGNGGISLIMGLLTIPAVIVIAGAGYLFKQNPTLAIPVLVIGSAALLAVLLVGAALSAIYSASVYYYAVNGEPPAGFDNDLINGAFTPKGA